MPPISPIGTAAPAAAPVGLTSAEAQRRLEQHGPNEIPEPRPHPVATLLKKFWGPVPWMLEATILIQLLLDKPGEAAIIGALLVSNALIGFVEEGRASRALALLRSHLTPRARVLRDGRWQSLSAVKLVPGDAVHLRVGEISPADLGSSKATRYRRKSDTSLLLRSPTAKVALARKKAIGHRRDNI